jgi:hypothetical protein
VIADFTQQCGSEEWLRHLPLGMIALLLYPLGIPLMFYFLLRRNRQNLSDPRVLISLGFL